MGVYMKSFLRFRHFFQPIRRKFAKVDAQQVTLFRGLDLMNDLLVADKCLRKHIYRKWKSSTRAYAHAP